jgi:hypothetical protein
MHPLAASVSERASRCDPGAMSRFVRRHRQILRRLQQTHTTAAFA